MKVLIVSFSFPPSNVIGAIRVGKLARYLDRRGHDLRVLTTDIVEDRSLPLEIAREQVIYTDYRQHADWLAPLVRQFRGRPAAEPDTSGVMVGLDGGAPRKSSWERLRRHYHGLMHIPDMRRDWVTTAVPAGRRLIEEWRPDIIFASAPPFTGLIVASRLSRAFGIPWIADFRDLWVDGPYYSEPGWRRPIDALLEQATVRNAAALVTVSPVWADQLRRRHGKIAEVVYNGYADDDFPEPLPQGDQGDVLRIRYTGSIYRGFRDPSPLFAAIGLLSDQLRDRVLVEFFGDAGDDILALAEKHGVRDRIEVKPPVPYRRALELQTQSDALLLLQSCDKRDEGNLPAKIFEYLYARRPILLIGYEHGVAARLIRERGAGLVATAPERIRDQLQRWVGKKRAGCLKRLDPSVSRGLGRDDQFRKLEHVFTDILKARQSLHHS
jgi:glycosyltransferase involved in cell wall biosynthesis